MAWSKSGFDSLWLHHHGELGKAGTPPRLENEHSAPGVAGSIPALTATPFHSSTGQSPAF